MGLFAFIGVWQYSKYEDRPRLMTSLNDIGLGMSEVDVTLMKGKPDNILDLSPKKYLIFGDLNGRYTYAILRKRSDLMIVTDICKKGGYINVLGFSEGSSEKSILEELGQAKNVSINVEGTIKILSYPEWNTTFEIEKGRVIQICVTSRPNMRFATEYSKP